MSELSDDARRLLSMLKAAEDAGRSPGRQVSLRDFDPPWSSDRAGAAMKELLEAGFAELTA